MIRIRRALFSAYHKEGLLPLARAAAEHGAELVSSGGTAAFLRDAGLAVTAVEEITGFGSLFGGRVKTLHPLIHGAILFRRDDESDRDEAEEIGVRPIDLVVVNLYPFGEARARGAGEEETIELIDVGGPAMVRAAAKNHRFVAVVTQPEDYAVVTEALNRGRGEIEESLSRSLATRAFRVTAEYDAAIAGWLESGAAAGASTESALPESWSFSAPRRRTLRYGENPSQAGGLYGPADGFPFNLEQLHGKELSYNNYLDLACGRDLLAEFGDDCVAAVIKHGIPCGTAGGASLAEAYRRARDADSLSAFGGVVCLNRAVDRETAELLNETFLEVVLAPGYAPEARTLLEKKKNRAVLLAPAEALRRAEGELRGRFCGGGILLQTALPAGSGETGWEIVTKRPPDAREAADLLFGWKVLKHVRSNGILFAKDGRTVGVGSGQCSRIDSVEAAIRKAGREGIDLAGAVMVSDAFFPFRDSVDRAHAAGITAVLQPGGSMRDEESVQACNEHGMAMAVNHARVFSHG